MEYFTIMDGISADDAYVVYTLDGKAYFRPEYEFSDNMRDSDTPMEFAALSEVDYDSDEQLTPIDENDAEITIQAIISSIINASVSTDINEHAKIRRPKLSTDYDIMNSKMVDDILHGDKEQRDFEEEVEKDTQANGIENPLAPSAPAQDESVKPKLPNVHRMALEEAVNYDIIYEANDKVIYKGKKAEVISVSEDGENVKIKLAGKTIDASPSDLEPDPEYINDLEIDDTEQHNALVQGVKPDDDKKKDLNKTTLDCNIVVDGQRLNMHECRAFLEDVIDSKHSVRIINEYGDIVEYPVDDYIEFTEWPYAVIANEEGEPLRKIKINPKSYINAGEDDMVDCICGDKETQFLKRTIKVLS